MTNLTEVHKSELKKILSLLRVSARVASESQNNNYIPAQMVTNFELQRKRVELITKDTFSSSFLEIGSSDVYSDGSCNASAFRNNIGQLISIIESYVEPTEAIIEIGVAINAVKDSQLRDRCLSLLKIERNFDTVIREATTILEDRIRNASQLDSKLFGVKLVEKALNLTNGALIIEGEDNEREGLYHIFRGVMLSFRDETHHRIVDDFSREDAIKVMSLIDLLLQILARAKKRV